MRNNRAWKSNVLTYAAPDDIHGQLSIRPVFSAAEACFRLAPHLYSTVSVFTTPGAGSPHQPLLTDTRHRGRKPPHAALTCFLISGPAVHVRPGAPYSASTISMNPVDIRCRTVQSSSMPPTNASATMMNVRRLGLIPAHFLLADGSSVKATTAAIRWPGAPSRLDRQSLHRAPPPSHTSGPSDRPSSTYTETESPRL